MTNYFVIAIFLFMSVITASAQASRNDAVALLLRAEKAALYAPEEVPPAYRERVEFTVSGDPALKGSFMKDFLSNESWRERYELGDFLRIEVRNGAQVGEFRTAAFEPVRIEQLRRALPPVVVRLGSNDAVKKVTSKTVNAVDVQCVEYQTSGANHQEENELCINRVDGTLVRLRERTIDGPCTYGCALRETEWSDYVPFGDKRYPRRVILKYRGFKAVEASLEFRAAKDLSLAAFDIPKDFETRRACNQISPPVRLKGAPPDYPHRMNEFLYEGTVLVQARIGVDGHVQDAEVATLRPGRKPSYGDYPALQGRDIDEAVKKAIQSWVSNPQNVMVFP